MNNHLQVPKKQQTSKIIKHEGGERGESGGYTWIILICPATGINSSQED